MKTYTTETEAIASLGSQPRTVFVTGKGGVGKTTVATGLATAAARIHGRSVYVEFSDGESGRRAGIDRQDGVKHVVLDLRRAVVKAAEQLFGSKRIARLALGNFAMRPLIKAAPALRELGVLELARQVVANHPDQSVVFDMPASGHCVGWLKTPGQVRRLAAHGPLHALCARLEDELISPETSSVVIVTLPERLVLSETLSLSRTMKEEVGLPVDRIVVNRVPTAPPHEAMTDATALSASTSPNGDAAAKLASHLAARLAARNEALEAVQATTTEGVSWSAAHPPLLLPLTASEPNASALATWLIERSAS